MCIRDSNNTASSQTESVDLPLVNSELYTTAAIEIVFVRLRNKKVGKNNCQKKFTLTFGCCFNSVHIGNLYSVFFF